MLKVTTNGVWPFSLLSLFSSLLLVGIHLAWLICSLTTDNVMCVGWRHTSMYICWSVSMAIFYLHSGVQKVHLLCSLVQAEVDTMMKVVDVAVKFLQYFVFHGSKRINM